MGSRGTRFSNPWRLLCEDDRLAGLRERVQAIDADLAELESLSEDERRENAELRDRVIDRFNRLREA